jgi:hypothetical protein
MILVYCQKITNRVRYIFNLMLCELAGADIKFTSDTEEFKAWTGAKISYHSQPVAGEIFFLSRPVLFENDIRDHEISVFGWEGIKVFFAAGKNSALPFDPFAAAFYLVSRYEEYLPHIKDQHERFDAKESLAYQKDFLNKPVINIWALKIREIIRERYPDLIFREHKYKFISTIDIDNAFAYREKGFVRTAGALARNLLQLDFEQLSERLNVLAGRIPDPYDTYDYQLQIQKKYGFPVIYFFLMADYGVNDKNVPVQSYRLQSLIKSLADYADAGIHPGYNSHQDFKKLKEEHARLKEILKREITKSRQHFLKLHLPDTCRNLIELDITDDYTMGYASRTGFRAGICSSFNFYDLDYDTETSLRMHPFAVMEGTLKYAMGIPPERAMEYIAPLIDEVKAVNGTFISLWHNESLSEDRLWKGWREVYEEMVKCASDNR